MGNLFQNLAPEHLIEIILIIFISAILGWLLSMLFWKKRLNDNASDWESRFDIKSKELADVRNEKIRLDVSLKETQDKFTVLESQLAENSSMSQKLADEKTLLASQLENISTSNQSIQKQLSDLEKVKEQHQKTLPILKSQESELQQLKKEIDLLTQQKRELNDVVNSLKDFRYRYEDLELQLDRSRQEAEELEYRVSELNEAILYEREEGPRVLELSGILRWIQSDNLELKEKLTRLDGLIDQAAFHQLNLDGQNVELIQKLDQLQEQIDLEEAKGQEAPENGDLQTYQIQVWERDGALRWAEQEKEELSQKISELEYAQSVLESEKVKEKEVEENGSPLVPEPASIMGIDAEGELTRLALDLEEVNEKNSILSAQLEEQILSMTEQTERNEKLENQIKEIQEKREELRSELKGKSANHLFIEQELQELQETHKDLVGQFSALQEKSLEWKGRLRWELLEGGDLKQEKEAISSQLAEELQRLEAQKIAMEELEGLLKRKEEDFQRLKQELASEELAQAFIRSEELEELSLEVDQLRSSSYLAAETEWNHLAAEAQLSLEAKKWREKVIELEKKALLIEEEKEWELSELRTQILEIQGRETAQTAELEGLVAELGALRESTHTAAQLHADDEAENLRISVKIKEMERDLLQLSELEAERTTLEGNLDELRVSLQSAAQTQADEEAASIRYELQIKHLQDQFSQLSQQAEAETSELLQEVKTLKESVEQNDQDRNEQLKEVEKLSKQLQDSQQRIEEISLQAESDQTLMEEFAATQTTLESERSFLEHRVKELQDSIQNAAQESADQLGNLVRLNLALKSATDKIAQLEDGTASKAHQIQDFSVKLEAQEQMHNQRIQALEAQLQLKQEEYQQEEEKSNQRIAAMEEELNSVRNESSQQEALHLQRVEELEEELATVSKSSKEKLDTQTEHISEVAETLKKAQEDWEKQEKMYGQIIQDLEEQLKTTKEEKEEKEELNSIGLDKLQKNLQLAQKESQDKDSTIQQLEKKLAELSDKLNNGLSKPSFIEDTPPASVSFAIELTEDEKDKIRERIFERRDYLELNFGRIGIASALDQDPLTEIAGIDPFTEERLNLIQIYSFRQLANFTAEEETLITEALELVPGIIQQQEWKSQAQAKLN